VSEEQIDLSLNSSVQLKFQLLDQVKLYGGLMFGVDGCTGLVGFKVAGVKLVIPCTGFEKILHQNQEEQSSFSAVLGHLAVNLAFVASHFYLTSRAKK